MSEKKYCLICEKRMPPQNGLAHELRRGGDLVMYRFYCHSFTEPVCFGHEDEPTSVAIPQAFYDAFEGEELQP